MKPMNHRNAMPDAPAYPPQDHVAASRALAIIAGGFTLATIAALIVAAILNY